MGPAAGGDEAMSGGGGSEGAARAVGGVGGGVSIMPLALTARGCAGSAGAGPVWLTNRPSDRPPSDGLPDRRPTARRLSSDGPARPVGRIGWSESV